MAAPDGSVRSTCRRRGAGLGGGVGSGEGAGGSGGGGSSMTIVDVPASGACAAAGGGEGTYTIRVGACRFGQPPMNNAKLHHKHGRALSFTSIEILSFPYASDTNTMAGRTLIGKPGFVTSLSAGCARMAWFESLNLGPSGRQTMTLSISTQPTVYHLVPPETRVETNGAGPAYELGALEESPS